MYAFDYVSSNDPMSRLDLRVKMLIVLTIGVITLVKWNLLALAILFALTVSPYLLFSRASLQRLRWWGKFMGTTIALLIISQGFFYWGYYQGIRVDVLFYLFKPHSNALVDLFTGGEGIALTSQGMYWGLLAGMKFGIMGMAAALTLMGVSPRDWSSLLSWARVPRFLQHLFLATVRITPVMLEESLQLYYIARLRRPGSIKNRLIVPYRLVKSMSFIAIRKAMLMTIALEIKGEPRFRPEVLKFRRVDLLAGMAWMAALLLVLLI